MSFDCKAPLGRCRWGAWLAGLLLLPGVARAQNQPSGLARGLAPRSQGMAAQPAAKTDFLKQFDTSLEALTAKVSPTVVQILVTGFGTVEEGGNNTAMVTRQWSLGSGVIVDPAGYIITNAHVVKGAQKIEVVLTTPAADGERKTAPTAASYLARLVGVHPESDLALLKIEASGLPYLPLDPKRPVHQGELVIAMGSPEGLGNSVTMGVVSSVDRQPDPDLPMVFIQTDAPINRGNSGGPLVDVDGDLVGINTFIMSSSGGSEGLGFAVPVRIVGFVYEKLRKFGHVDRSEIGATAESISPLLAQGLHLPVSSGVIVSDVEPGGPAASSGLAIGDIVLSVDGREVTSLPKLSGSLYLHPTDEVMTMEVLRGKDKLTLHIPVSAQRHEVDQLLNLVDPQEDEVEQLGVLAINLDSKIRTILPETRINSGVVVAAKAAYHRMVDVGLKPGDVIHFINTKPVSGLRDLRATLAELKPGDAVVLQIERAGIMDYIAFEME